ncbi:pectate lyase [Magnaporthiopsis poae ATCC 64411]|uniref:Pectate lyase n=1 Tax=Magnaporthiopsis poae (strain ATCC 64411 / 73-15) TaxID=644358 RepID=A0A0C4E488_MAGP6|nr:pectate lyase [Magnaporthiopsis poae ATCC 64411]
MRFSGIATLLLGLAAASPVAEEQQQQQLTRRQASQACNIGFCTQNGGTTGGAAGPTVTVRTLAELQSNVSGAPKSTMLPHSEAPSTTVNAPPDKTIYGERGSSLTGVGLYVRRVSNVIIRNMKISGVKASNGDAVGIDASTNVWVDHCDLRGDLSGGKDDLDGLVDVSHGGDFITISYTYFHDSWKASLVGHSDSNGSEDRGKLRVTYAHNHWQNVNSRTPLVRFGTVHVVNSYYQDVLGSGINTRMGAQVLVQSSAFANSNKKAIFFADSKETGFAVAEDVALGGSQNTAPAGSLTSSSLPYRISGIGSGGVAGTVPGQAGQKL